MKPQDNDRTLLAAELIESAARELRGCQCQAKHGRHLIAIDELSAMHSKISDLPQSWHSRCAWAIIAELYSVFHEVRVAYVKHICLASPIPATTTLRHLQILVDEGWTLRVPCEDDRRKVHLTLSEQSIERIEIWADK